MKYGLLLLLALMLTVPVQAQDTIATDRPDFTESPSTVPQGMAQGEFGMTQESYDGATITTAGEGLVRYGLRPRFELRVGVPSHITFEGLDGGLGDPSIGFKWSFMSFGEGGQAAIVGTFNLPIGDDIYTADEVEPAFLIVAGRPLTEKVNLAAQAGLQAVKAGDDWYGSYQATAVVSMPLTSAIGAFAEVRMDAPPLQDEQLRSHFGLTWLSSDNLQLDVHGGFGLSDDAPDHFFGLGLAFRR